MIRVSNGRLHARPHSLSTSAATAAPGSTYTSQGIAPFGPPELSTAQQLKFKELKLAAGDRWVQLLEGQRADGL